jgi:hypothetical protein
MRVHEKSDQEQRKSVMNQPIMWHQSCRGISSCHTDCTGNFPSRLGQLILFPCLLANFPSSTDRMWRKFKKRNYRESEIYGPPGIAGSEASASLAEGRVSLDRSLLGSEASHQQQPITVASSKSSDFGLHVLADQPSEDPDAIDIVALHGLNGHWNRTWQATNSAAMWLRDFLPQQIPRARIMSFGYDSLVLSKSVANVGIFAEQLLEALMAQRNGLAYLQSRPIIFVCHSLGGIVVKKVRLSKVDYMRRYS